MANWDMVWAQVLVQFVEQSMPFLIEIVIAIYSD